MSFSNRRIDEYLPVFDVSDYHETRVLATDPASRRRFRRYWLAVGLGIRLIRIEALRLVKRDLESEARPDTEPGRSLTSRA